MKTIKISLALAILFLFAISLTAFAAPDDSVLSQHVKEADGTTGQDTNTGSGIKTGHIQDGAVTTNKIADGAVTDTKITGPISSSKINGLEAALAGKADVTHNHDALYQQKYGKVAVVAQTGGDYTDPVTAMNNLSTWCGTPSATNPCLLKIMPGVYDIGANTLWMQPYVDIEGSGENVTKISGNASDNFGMIFGQSNSELRFLTAENNRGGGGSSIAVYLWHANNMKITNVTAVSSNNEGGSTGIKVDSSISLLTNVTVFSSGAAYVTGIASDNGSLTLNNVTVNVSNGGYHGIFLNGGSFVMTNLTVNMTGAGGYGITVWTYASIKINNAKIQSSGPGIWNSASQLELYDVKIDALFGGVDSRDNATSKIINSVIKSGGVTSSAEGTSRAYLANTMVDGGSVQGNNKCFGVYDGNFDPYTCP